MLKLHLVSIFSRRQFLAICAFMIAMICIAMTFAGWLSEMSSALYAGWILLLIWNDIGLYLLVAGDDGRSELFLALGLQKKWCRAEILAHFLVMCAFIAIWMIMMGIWFEWTADQWIWAGCMALFSGAFAQASLGNLQKKVIGLPERKKMSLLIVVSAPWALTSWILGLFACKASLSGDSCLMYVLAMLLLAVFNTILGLFSGDEPAQRRQKYEDKP